MISVIENPERISELVRVVGEMMQQTSPEAARSFAEAAHPVIDQANAHALLRLCQQSVSELPAHLGRYVLDSCYLDQLGWLAQRGQVHMHNTLASSDYGLLDAISPRIRVCGCREGIQLRHRQPSLCDAFWSEEVSDLWEPWMRVADRLLEDEALLDHVYDAQALLDDL